jgi:hypothetical protein
MIKSKEGHSFSTRDEVVGEILSHSGNYDSETNKPLYDRQTLFTWGDDELIGWLASLFSVEFEGQLESVTTVINRRHGGT